MTKFVTFFGVVLGLFVSTSALAESNGSTSTATADATMTVQQRILITKTKDLAFTTAFQDDALQTIAQSDAAAATFNVTGQQGKTFLVNFPSASIYMVKNGVAPASAAAKEKILVDNFTTNISSSGSGAPGFVNGTTAIVVRVGATRAKLLIDQEIASYTGSFSVKVTYQ